MHITKKEPLAHTLTETLITAAGSFAGIGILTFLSYTFKAPVLLASFGASAVLVYGAPQSPLAQPRNLVGGHLISAFIGITTFQLLGDHWYSASIAVTASILLMLLSKTIHPPGGATALVCVMQHCGYKFLLTPVLAGAIILLLIALLANHFSPKRTYPVKDSTS